MNRETGQQQSSQSLISRTAFAILWIVVASLSAQILYGSLGFNPTDEGFTLAYARRILDGQIPHRDFIIIRPALSPLFHVPELILGGAWAFVFSRFIFFAECATIAWLATSIAGRGSNLGWTRIECIAVASIAMAFCCHSFPAMAWHTIDGLLLCSLGIEFRMRRLSPPIAYALIGVACLCKQSFIFVAPAALCIFGDWRRWSCIIASAAPGAIYLLVLVCTGALPEALTQLLAQTGLLRTGFLIYARPVFFAGLPAGFIAAAMLSPESPVAWPRDKRLRHLTAIAIFAIMYFLAVAALASDGIASSSFTILGVLCGVLLHAFLERRIASEDPFRTCLIAALLAWSASVSVGYNTPALGSGIIIVTLLAFLHVRVAPLPGFLRTITAVTASIVAVVAFHHTRMNDIYHDRSAALLTETLDDVLPGARHIRTNSNTRDFLADLNAAVARATADGSRYAILPEIAAHWATSSQANPLPIDWAQATELSTPALVDRVICSLDRKRAQQTVIVQKYVASALSGGFAPLKSGDPWFPVVGHVRSNFSKVGETRCFELYR